MLNKILTKITTAIWQFINKINIRKFIPHALFVIIGTVIVVFTGTVYRSTVYRSEQFTNINYTPQLPITPETINEEYDITPQPFISPGHLNIEKIKEPVQYSDISYNRDNGLFGYGDGYIREDNSDRFRFVYSRHLKENIVIFPPSGSHEYNGYKIEFAHDNETLKYMGFKIGNMKLISNLEMELVFDGRDGLSAEYNKPLAFVNKACACGPGIILSRIGSSDLNFFAQSGDISWFRLQNPLPFENGARMQIFYKPTGNFGDTDIQLHSLILDRKNLPYRQVIFNTAAMYKYRVSFVDESIGLFTLEARSNAIDLRIRNTGQDLVIFDDSTLNYLLENLVSSGFKQINVKTPDGHIQNYLSRESLVASIRDRVVNPGENYEINNFSNVDRNKILYVDYDDVGISVKLYIENLEITENKKRIYSWSLQNPYINSKTNHILYLITKDKNGNAILDTPSSIRKSLLCKSSRCNRVDYLLPTSQKFWSALDIKKDDFLVVKELTGPVATLENVSNGIIRTGLTTDTVENYIKKTGGVVFDELNNTRNEKIVTYRYNNIIGYIKTLKQNSQLGTSDNIIAVFEVDRETLIDSEIAEFITWFININPISVE